MTPGELWEIVLKHRSPGVRWRIYPNPWRDDCVFLAEDKPIEPDGVGLDGPLYPATPKTDHRIPFGVDPYEARLLVTWLNMPEAEFQAALPKGAAR